MSDERRSAFERQNADLQEKLRLQHGARKERPLLAYDAALANRLRIDWVNEAVLRPAFTGRRTIAPPIEELVPYIDWTFFFAAWELKGRFPAILDHPKQGKAARDLYDSAPVLLDRVVQDQLLTTRGVYGFWPAASEDDDIVLYPPSDLASGGRDLSSVGEIARFNMLRQQETVPSGQPNLSLADFVGPRDYLGAFAVTTGFGADDLARRFERENDDYSAILVKALADRLAEAFAAYL